MRPLYHVRALPHVPWRHLLGAAAGFDDAFIYKELKRPLAARRIPMEQLLRDESREIFSLWKRQENKIPY